MTDLERLFRLIVSRLDATDPSLLHQPLSLSDIREKIVPYRANRRALQLESSEDYELVLMRLCAGEGSFARTEPEEARAALAAEVGSSNPDLTAIYRHEQARISLEPKAVAAARKPETDLAFAPPEYAPTARRSTQPASEPSPGRRPSKPEAVVPQSQAKPARCTRCGGDLPAGRAVKFCPHCGSSQSPTHCPKCKTELEPGWRHCVGCGHPLQAR